MAARGRAAAMIEALAALGDTAAVAAAVLGPGSDEAIELNADRELAIASVGKLALLIEVARRFEDGSLDPDEPLRRDAAAPVADSGLWQHLAVAELSCADAALLVAAVSDNLATNVLIERVGLAAVADAALAAGLKRTHLHDRVRDERGRADPPLLASGSAAELAGLMRRLGSGELISAAVSARLRGWLATNADLALVGAGFGLDPLARGSAARGPLLLINKTGRDAGVRAECGTVSSGGRRIDYAAIVNWEGDACDPGAVERALRVTGTAIAAALDAG